MYQIEASQMNAIELKGSPFINSIVLPAPAEWYMEPEKATTATVEIFNTVVKTYDITMEAKMDPVPTSEFIEELHDIIQKKLDWYAKTQDTSNQETIKQIIDVVFPEEHTTSELPDTIHNQGVVMQITRTVLQSIFNQLRSEPTNIYAENPFALTEHKWENVIQEPPIQNSPEH